MPRTELSPATLALREKHRQARIKRRKRLGIIDRPITKPTKVWKDGDTDMDIGETFPIIHGSLAEKAAGSGWTCGFAYIKNEYGTVRGRMWLPPPARNLAYRFAIIYLARGNGQRKWRRFRSIKRALNYLKEVAIYSVPVHPSDPGAAGYALNRLTYDDLRNFEHTAKLFRHGERGMVAVQHRWGNGEPGIYFVATPYRHGDHSEDLAHRRWFIDPYDAFDWLTLPEDNRRHETPAEREARMKEMMP